MFQEKYKYLPHLFILLAGSMWGCTGLFNRHLSALGLSSQNIVLVRNLGACVALILIFLFYDRSLFRIRLRHLPIFLGTGLVSLLLFTLCYFRCQQVTDLSTAAILLYTAPTFVVVLSAILWREKITKRKLAALVIAFLGCCFASGILSGGLSVSRYGLLLGIGSGFFYSTYTIFSRYGLAHYPPYTCTLYTFLVAGLGSLALSRPADFQAVAADPRAIPWMLGLIAVTTVLPYILYTRGLAGLGDGGKASILASVEPVVASFVGILAFGEPLSIGVVLGLACILASVYILR